MLNKYLYLKTVVIHDSMRLVLLTRIEELIIQKIEAYKNGKIKIKMSMLTLMASSGTCKCLTLQS